MHFGARPALFLALSSRLVLAPAPPGPTGAVDVTVATKADGTSATSSADRFTYR